MNAHGTFSPAKWDEKTIDHISTVQKITKASVVLDFGEAGEIAGTAMVEWLLFYSYSDEKDQHNSTASYVGLMRFEGSLNGTAGSFVMEDKGTFDKGALNATLTILSGSGTGGLENIRGTAKYDSSSAGIEFEMEYELK